MEKSEDRSSGLTDSVMSKVSNRIFLFICLVVLFVCLVKTRQHISTSDGNENHESSRQMVFQKERFQGLCLSSFFELNLSV